MLTPVSLAEGRVQAAPAVVSSVGGEQHKGEKSGLREGREPGLIRRVRGARMDVKQVLEELMAIPEQRSPVASVYLDTRRTDQHERHAVRLLVEDSIRGALKSTGRGLFDELKATFDPIEQYVEALLRQRIDEWATGVALFSCAPGKLFRVVRTRLPFEPMQFVLDPRPQVLPLAKTVLSVPPLILAAVDSEGALIFEASGGIVDVAAQLDQRFPGRHSMGGWSQANWERHIERILDRNLEHSAQPLVRMADLIQDAVIILAGHHQLLNDFERFLPQRVLERVAARIPYRKYLADREGELREDLITEAWVKFDEVLRERMLAERDVALAEAAREGIGVEGTKGVLLALNEGRIHKLFLDPTWYATGWECTNCEAVGEADHEDCPYCASELRAVDLREKVVRRAIRKGAEIAFLPADERLPEGLGMAALLRHRRTFATAPTLGNVPLEEQ